MATFHKFSTTDDTQMVINLDQIVRLYASPDDRRATIVELVNGNTISIKAEYAVVEQQITGAAAFGRS